MRCRVGFALLFAALGAAPAVALGTMQSPPTVDNPGEVVPFYRLGVDTYQVIRYVLVRESHDPKSVQSAFDTMALLSAPAVQLGYHKLHDGPRGRNRALGTTVRIELTIASVEFTAEFQALVRFTTRKVDTSNGRNEPRQPWIATIGYTYLPAPRNAEDRRINPWGFQATSYRVEPESIAAGEGKP